MQDNIQNAIQQALDESPERKFVESVEIAFTLKDVDLKNPANRIQEEEARGHQIVRQTVGAGSQAFPSSGCSTTGSGSSDIVILDSMDGTPSTATSGEGEELQIKKRKSLEAQKTA